MLPVAAACAAASHAETPAAGVQDFACPSAPAVVVARSPDDVPAACDGAAAAYAFLVPLGVTAPDRVRIELVPALPTGPRSDAVGCYAVESRRIFAVTYDHFVSRGQWFGVPIDATLYRSVITHEVAHAIVGCHLGERRVSTPANEYVAYVTMFATMPPALREQALAATPGSGFDSLEHINTLIYAFDPQRFGADAYRHWRRQADGATFLRRVIAGEAITDIEVY